MQFFLYFISILSIFVSSCATTKIIPSSEFLELNNTIPSVKYEIRYYTTHNFIGEKLPGYLSPKCLTTSEAANSISKIQTELLKYGMSLKIYDCYRPQKTVLRFVEWAKDLKDLKMKKEFYPNVKKENLFRDGYIAEKSGHSRGSTIDLTLIELGGKDLDMGTPYDLFDIKAHTDYSDLTLSQRKNRILLRSIMEKNGFKGIQEEWWHFTLVNEPYPNQYFDFDIK